MCGICGELGFGGARGPGKSHASFAQLALDDCRRYPGLKTLYLRKVGKQAREQFEEGTPIDADNLSIGDLVFFRTYASYPSHVGIYLGNNLFIHASSKKKKVTIDSLKTPFYIKRYIGAKRLLDVSAQNESPRTEG